MTVFIGFIFVGLAALTTRFLLRVISSHIEPPRSVFLIISAFVLFFVCLLAPFLVLGYAEIIFGRPVVAIPDALAGESLLCLIAYAAWRRTAIASASRSSTEVVSDSAMDRRTRLLVLGTLVVFLAVGIMVSLGFPRGYEPAAYHLPIAIHIIQTHSFVPWDMAW